MTQVVRGQAKIYCLKCDISKYFDNIDHEVLQGMLRWKIRDEDILWLLRKIVASNPKGIPIGRIVDVQPVDYGSRTEARVKLAANLNALEEVWVMFP